MIFIIAMIVVLFACLCAVAFLSEGSMSRSSMYEQEYRTLCGMQRKTGRTHEKPVRRGIINKSQL